MSVLLREEPINAVAVLAAVPIAFPVDRIFEVSVPEHGSIQLSEVLLDVPWQKDYDAEPHGGPAGWARRFDTANWVCVVAFDGGASVGGAVVAYDTPGLDLLEGRTDLAVLWDLRVRPERRRSGVGTSLFRAVEDSARRRACRTLTVETQNVNVPACRFYQRMGCGLASVKRHAYPELPDEIQLIWRKDL